MSTVSTITCVSRNCLKRLARKESEMEKGVFTPSLIPQINPIARKIGKTQIFSDFRVKTNESVPQLMIFFSYLGEKTYSIMNDFRCHRLFHFDFFIANQMIRSTVHVTHYVWLGWAATMIGEHCLSGAFSRFFMYDAVASTLQKCRFSYPCWSGKNAGTAGWKASLLSMHLCVSVFFVTRSQ